MEPPGGQRKRVVIETETEGFSPTERVLSVLRDL
jgi:hypothetical protein